MGAFIIAGVIVAITLPLSYVLLMVEAMSDGTGNHFPIVTASVFFGGLGFAALILASHWFPHIGW